LKKKNTGKSKNICRMSGGCVGAESMVKRCAKPCCPGTNSKRSQIALAENWDHWHRKVLKGIIVPAVPNIFDFNAPGDGFWLQVGGVLNNPPT